MDFTDSRLPLHVRLADVLRERVQSAEWKEGEPLPSEAVLARDYDVSVGTVRRALGDLRNEGILSRRQGQGTFVRRPKFDKSLFRFFRYDLGGEVPGSRILSRNLQPAGELVAKSLDIEETDQVIHLHRLRMHRGKPFLVEDIWLDYSLFAPVFEVPEEEIGDLLYPMYETMCDQVVASALETLRVEAATEEEARYLDCKAGDSTVVIHRIARGFRNQPVEFRRSGGLAADFQYSVEIR